jgi:hypothetical protein
MKAREIVLLLLIIAAGVTVHEVREGNIPFVWDLDEGFLWNGREFSYEETLTLDAPMPGALVVENAHGAVDVQAAATDTIAVLFTKRIYRRDEHDARAVADRLRAVFRREADRVVLSSNRSDFKRRRGFGTDFKIVCPAGTAVTVQNSYGKVVADGLAALSVENPHGEVRAGRIAGPVSVVSTYNEVELLDCGADVSVDARHSDVSVRNVKGKLTALQHYGSIQIEGVAGVAKVDANHAALTALDCPAGLEISDSYETIRLVRVGPVRIEADHADIEAEEVGGTCWIRDFYADVRLTGVRGAVTIDGRSLSVTGRSLSGAENSVTTSYESVDLGGFSGRTVVRLSHGDLTLAPAALTGALEVQAEYAKIRLVWPAGERCPLEARSRGGRVHWALDAPSQTETNGSFVLRAFEDATGRPPVTLSTTYEDIVIE